MDGLRWLLLLFGVIVIAGVYFYTRYQRMKAEASPQKDLFDDSREPMQVDAPRVEPVFGLSSNDAIDDDETEPNLEAVQQKIVTLRVVGRDNRPFPGDDLVLSLRGIGMRHGKFGIFHAHDGDDDATSVFCAASLVEPGSFDLANIKDQEIPGISLFLILPGPIDGAQAFDQMVAAARALTQALDAELFDETGSTLSIQRERYLREEIIQYEHATGVA